MKDLSTLKPFLSQQLKGEEQSAECLLNTQLLEVQVLLPVINAKGSPIPHHLCESHEGLLSCVVCLSQVLQVSFTGLPPDLVALESATEFTSVAIRVHSAVDNCEWAIRLDHPTTSNPQQGLFCCGT